MKDEKFILENVMLNKLMKKIEDFNTIKVFDGWVSKKTLMKFIDYGETQFRIFVKQENLIMSKLGTRKFYSTQQIIEILKKNTINEK